ncbi:alpha/beta fold hydrolase [Neobacillus dielmonensis]|uniref:alpha/beta fold hydrolase n=1 Tax=Neobacillus dielmonensis TaxID=1347369 RepID=UPI0005A5D846|nr:alpha/beta hydrolase [Neobacillus dielmonensis]
MIEAKISSTRIPYLHFGKGVPLVLIHGLGEVKEGWMHQFELAEGYELIIPDLRGHGDCNKTQGITINNFATDIIQLLKELNIESAHILGLSMGGAVAQEIYRQSPSICSSLILVSTFHYFPKKFKKFLFENRKAKFEAVTASGNQTEYLAKMALFSWNCDTLANFKQLFKPKHQIFLDSLESCLEVNNLTLLRKIQIPTLIIGGQYDSVLPVWIQACMHKQIPNSKFVIIRNTGHLAKLEAKEHFNHLLRSFLDQQASVG